MLPWTVCRGILGWSAGRGVRFFGGAQNIKLSSAPRRETRQRCTATASLPSAGVYVHCRVVYVHMACGHMEDLRASSSPCRHQNGASHASSRHHCHNHRHRSTPSPPSETAYIRTHVESMNEHVVRAYTSHVMFDACISTHLQCMCKHVFVRAHHI
jgi:hypothetical protein